MTDPKKILVIDDSSTIRRLVDNFLSPEGYQLALASTAEEGFTLASEVQPDLILLDHQLPGTTGYEVCCKLGEDPKLCMIPVVISSTLRNKAYVEYAELPNVVDMLPKPYTSDLLTMTVKNALDTGAMVVASQTDGSAVPEVIDAPHEAALAGDFSVFTLRETLDFLTNTSKQGTLQVEGRTVRMSFYLSDGRIQGATASGLNSDELERTLPADLRPLAPVLRMTVTGAAGNQLQGLVELLDMKVVDSQLLKRMLRYQASQLLMRSFKEKLIAFNFQVGQPFPDVAAKLPLEVSTLALLVDGALVMEEDELPGWSDSHCFTRRMSRNHSLDRSGMSTKHVKLAGLSTQPQTLKQLADKHQLPADEAKRVLFGLSLGEIVEPQAGESGVQIAAIGFPAEQVAEFRATLEQNEHSADWSLHEMKDSLALKMQLRKRAPDVLVVNLADVAITRSVALLRQRDKSPLQDCRLLGVGDEGNIRAPLDCCFQLSDGRDSWANVANGCWRDAGRSPATQFPPHVPPADSSLPPADADSADPANSNGSAAADSSGTPSPQQDDKSEAKDQVSGLDSLALLNKLQAQGAFDD